MPKPDVTAPQSARTRVRAELTAEIIAVARRQLAEVGAASLSLRAVARELGMVSSAVYRYFPSRDELLTALIVEAYDAVGAAAESTESGAGRRSTAARWLHLARAIRAWASEHPQQYALIYGSPVPGYRAPADTIDPALRVSLVLLRLVADGVANGEIQVAAVTSAPVPRAVHADFDLLRAIGVSGLEAFAHVPDAVVSRALAVWTQLFGTISFELFGHLHNVIHDHDAFFDLQMRSAALLLVGSGPKGTGR